MTRLIPSSQAPKANLHGFFKVIEQSSQEIAAKRATTKPLPKPPPRTLPKALLPTKKRRPKRDPVDGVRARPLIRKKYGKLPKIEVPKCYGMLYKFSEVGDLFVYIGSFGFMLSEPANEEEARYLHELFMDHLRTEDFLAVTRALSFLQRHIYDADSTDEDTGSDSPTVHPSWCHLLAALRRSLHKECKERFQTLLFPPDEYSDSSETDEEIRLYNEEYWTNNYLSDDEQSCRSLTPVKNHCYSPERHYAGSPFEERLAKEIPTTSSNPDSDESQPPPACQEANIPKNNGRMTSPLLFDDDDDYNETGDLLDD